ncbi:helix-turn-helix transcriptional regulator [Elstera litoralis]|uniref:helix-turn-helix transcriptional regulator n=1 Tax=Elstera litoralis TaxID=552518 RepID=UPI000AB51B9F|nr:AraC family transcriptional regulator [Elstera litoralis]
MARSAPEFQLLPCALPGVQRVRADTRHQFPKHIHEGFGIGLIHRGAQKSLSGRGMVEAGPGQVITVNPGEVHDGRPIGDGGRFWTMLYLTPAAMARAAAEIDPSLSGDIEFTEPVLPHAAPATGLFTANGDALFQEERLLLLLAGLLRRKPEVAEAVPPGLRHARALIDSDPGAPLHLSDLAEVAGLSRFQIVRSFMRLTGLTPHAYLVQRRLQYARRLMDEALPLAEVAVAAGFADQSHFTRLFARQFWPIARCLPAGTGLRAAIFFKKPRAGFGLAGPLRRTGGLKNVYARSRNLAGVSRSCGGRGDGRRRLCRGGVARRASRPGRRAARGGTGGGVSGNPSVAASLYQTRPEADAVSLR